MMGIGGDGDIECTCDVGPFATCPACQSQPTKPYVPPEPKKRQFDARLDLPLDEYVARVRAGLHWR